MATSRTQLSIDTPSHGVQWSASLKPYTSAQNAAWGAAQPKVGSIRLVTPAASFVHSKVLRIPEASSPSKVDRVYVIVKH